MTDETKQAIDKLVSNQEAMNLNISKIITKLEVQDVKLNNIYNQTEKTNGRVIDAERNIKALEKIQLSCPVHQNKESNDKDIYQIKKDLSVLKKIDDKILDETEIARVMKKNPQTAKWLEIGKNVITLAAILGLLFYLVRLGNSIEQSIEKKLKQKTESVQIK